MNTRSLFWGTPKSLLLSTCHSTSYPSSSSVDKMIANVLPSSCDRSPLTFSSSKKRGSICLVILAISKNRVPLVSSNPRRSPAIENAWQGNPPVMRSTFPLSSLASLFVTFVMSYHSTSPSVSKLTLYVRLANSSISQKPIHVCPARSSASLNPPIPANKSKNLMLPPALCINIQCIFIALIGQDMMGSVSSPSDQNQTLSLLAHHAPNRKLALHNSQTTHQGIIVSSS